MDDLRAAFDQADRLTKQTAREHIVRNRGFAHKPDYIVVPRYEAGFEGGRSKETEDPDDRGAA